jgi:hypothetical protein
MGAAHTLAAVNLVNNYTGTLTLAAQLTLNGETSEMTSGTIQQKTPAANGPIVVASTNGGPITTFDWQGGNINPTGGPSTFTVQNGADVIFDQPAGTSGTFGDDLVNNGYLQLNNASTVTLANRPTITNNGLIGITVDNAFGQVLATGDPEVTIQNSGTIVKTTSTGGSYGIDDAVNNKAVDAQINAGDGTLIFKKPDPTTGGSVNQSQGTITVNGAASLQANYGLYQTGGTTIGLSGATINGNVSIFGGTLQQGDGTAGQIGALIIGGNLDFEGGTLQVYVDTTRADQPNGEIRVRGAKGATIKGGVSAQVGLVGEGKGPNTLPEVVLATAPGATITGAPTVDSNGYTKASVEDLKVGKQKDLYLSKPPPKPRMGALTPANGSVTGGTAVALFGQNFTGATGVSFGGTPAASYLVVSDSEIWAVAPAGGAGAVDVTVTTSNGTSDTTSADLFAYSSTLTNTTVSVSSSASTTAYGQNLTLTATVSASGSGTPTGSVTFLDGSGTVLGSGILNSSGVATLTLTGLSAGDDLVTAVYSGDQNYAGAAATPLDQAVTPAATTLTLTSSANPAPTNTPVTFTATAASTAGIPTGAVDFWQVDPSTGADILWLGTETLNASGQATLTLSTLPAGSDAVEGVYLGDGNFNPKSSTLTQVITANTTTTLSASANPATAGQAVTFTASVTGQPGLIPTGTVTFYNGTSVLGTASVMAGIATFRTAALPVGSDSITAVYGGDASNSGSTSAVLTEVVNKAQTMVMLSSSSNPAMEGQPVTFTANVSPLAGVTPTGTVTFYDGTTALGTVTLNAMGTAALTLSNLAVGSHSITAVYSGDATYTASTSSALQEVIDGQGSMTSLTSSQNPAPAGSPVTFTATVMGMPGTPTGQVQFWVLDPTTLLPVTLLGTGTLNGSGQASLTVSSLSSGSYFIEALYLGDSTFNSSSSTLTQQIS